MQDWELKEKAFLDKAIESVVIKLQELLIFVL